MADRDDINESTTATLGERILAAARLAMTLHLEAQFQDSFRQQVTSGGAGFDPITDDELPAAEQRGAA